MDRSSASNPSHEETTQQSSTRPRVRKIPSTPQPEAMTPPTAQAMVMPAVSASQPPETSDANKFKEEEERPNPIPLEIPTDLTTPVGTPATQLLEEPTPMSATFPIEDSAEQNQKQEDEAEVEPDEEVNNQEEGRDDEASREAEDPEEETVHKPVEEEDQRGEGDVKTWEIVVLEEDESEFEEETLDERAMRRSLRTTRKEEMVEVEGKLVESVRIIDCNISLILSALGQARTDLFLGHSQKASN